MQRNKIKTLIALITITSSIIILSPKTTLAVVESDINIGTSVIIKESNESINNNSKLDKNKSSDENKIEGIVKEKNYEQDLKIKEKEKSKRLNENLESIKDNSILEELNKSKIKTEENIAKDKIAKKVDDKNNDKETVEINNRNEELKLEKEKEKIESEKLEKKIESEKTTKLEEKKEKERKAREEEKRANNAIHSNTQRKLYNYLKSEKNCKSTFKEAVRLHGGDTSNNCVYFTSEALRRVGVKIPKDICYTTKLESELIYIGWKRSTNFSDLQRGDICFAGVDHAFTFMGWADKDKMIANIADNQYKKFKKHLHERPLYEDDEKEISKTTHYYKL